MASNQKILVIGQLPSTPSSVNTWELFCSRFNVVLYDFTSRHEFYTSLESGICSDIQGMMVVGSPPRGCERLGQGWTREALKHFPSSLCIISHLGHGYESEDIAGMTKRGIVFSNSKGAAEATASIGLYLIIAAFRHLAYFEKLDPYGKALGIVGMGTVGQTLARQAVGLGMKVHFVTRQEEAGKEAMRKGMGNEGAICSEPQVDAMQHADLSSMLPVVDCVALTCPYNESTHHLLDSKSFSKMKKGVRIINIARGKCIDELALVDALEKGVVGGVGLDVYENEPKIHPKLLKHDYVTLLPHVGGLSQDVMACTRLNLHCEGYGPRISFVDQSSEVVERAKGRAPKRRRRNVKDNSSTREPSSSPADHDDPTPRQPLAVENRPTELVFVNTPTAPSPLGLDFLPQCSNEMNPMPTLFGSINTLDTPEELQNGVHLLSDGSQPSLDNSEDLMPYTLNNLNQDQVYLQVKQTTELGGLEEAPSNVSQKNQSQRRESFRAGSSELEVDVNADTNTRRMSMLPPTYTTRVSLTPLARPLSNTFLSLCGAYKFSEDVLYYQYLVDNSTYGLAHILPLKDILKTESVAPHVYSAALALSALSLSNLNDSKSSRLPSRRHALQHSMTALQGVRNNFPSTGFRGCPVTQNLDILISWLLTVLLLANFELQRGFVASWRSHLRAAGSCLGIWCGEFQKRESGRLLIQAFARMSLLLVIYNAEYAATTLDVLPPGLMEHLQELLIDSPLPQDRLLPLIKEVGELEINYRRQPEQEEKWTRKGNKLLAKLDTWQRSLPSSEFPVDDGTRSPLSFPTPSDSQQPLITPLHFRSSDPCASACNYANFLCARMRIRTRYPSVIGRIIPPDSEQTVHTICKIAAGISPALCGQANAYSHGMLPAVIGAYRWTTDIHLRKWVIAWLSGYQSVREGIWNVSRSIRLCSFMDKKYARWDAADEGRELVACRIVDEPDEEVGDEASDKEKAHTKPFKVVVHSRGWRGWSTEFVLVP
ncbi:MAG: hypothetical protein M1834_005231 [Cirrosporium novae-zelandiae]|nr:MAG: hypothetical protein M1834_005231 [Cirrosporium novae-zelandiae]